MKFIFNLFGRLYFHYIFKKCVSNIGTKALVIVDIDNTLADTWPSLVNSSNDDDIRLRSLKIFSNMKNLVLLLNKSTSRKLLFLTARSYKHYNVTCDWLVNNGVNVAKNQVVIVQNPAEKVELIEQAVNRKVRVILIDDLSYNHEKGEVKFYKKEIDRLAALKVKHIGYDSILKYNKKGM